MDLIEPVTDSCDVDGNIRVGFLLKLVQARLAHGNEINLAMEFE